METTKKIQFWIKPSFFLSSSYWCERFQLVLPHISQVCRLQALESRVLLGKSCLLLKTKLCKLYIELPLNYFAMCDYTVILFLISFPESLSNVIFLPTPILNFNFISISYASSLTYSQPLDPVWVISPRSVMVLAWLSHTIPDLSFFHLNV